jgi:hypothetical protein
MTEAERRLDNYRSWLWAIAHLAAKRDEAAAAALFERWSREHGV